MAYSKKTWVNRVSQFPTRRRLINVEGEEDVFDISREEGNITTAGDSFSAENMNDLEERISDAFDDENDKPTIYVGTAEPSASLGKDGDIYIKYTA